MANILSPSNILSRQVEMAERMLPVLPILWELFINWGWVFLPFLLWPAVKEQWLFWRNELWDEESNKQTLIEVRIPGEIIKPMRAMETVLAGFWQLYGPPNWFEKWWKGQYDLSFSLEIASIEGVPRFLIRIPEKQRKMFEQHIYGQYPEAEIFEVEDYTENVPKNIPNERWEIWGTDHFMPKDCYPLKTYRDFETEREQVEEKRIDPIAHLIEGLSDLGEGEQMWFMIKAKPVTDAESGFQERAKKEYEKLVGRKEKPETPHLLYQISSMIFGYPKESETKEESELYPEMKLTPGERDIVAGIERKRTSHFFECFIRYVYIAKKDKFSASRIKIPMSYLNQFNNQGLGATIPLSSTITKVKQNWWDWFWLLDKRLYIKKRKMFRSFVRRLPASFPVEKKDESFILSAEEIGSIYHFPSRTSSPTSLIQRVDARKKEAPGNLPIDEENK